MGKNLKGCFLHESDDWSTPKKFYDHMMSVGFFDPCPLHSNFDGLSIDWPKRVFVNPPYSNISAFIDKAISEISMDINKVIVFLVPVRTDTKWFKRIFPYLSSIRFITGRLHFGGGKNGAPFPSMLLIINKFTLLGCLSELTDKSDYE